MKFSTWEDKNVVVVPDLGGYQPAAMAWWMMFKRISIYHRQSIVNIPNTRFIQPGIFEPKDSDYNDNVCSLIMLATTQSG